MRKPLTTVLLLLFICALPLQVLAQARAMHCALMQAGIQDGAGLDASHDSERNAACAQSGACQLTTCMQVSALPSFFAGLAFDAVSSRPTSPVTFVQDRALSPPHRPPICS